jgi:hypothetical protein
MMITITGILVADQWSGDGTVAGLALLTDDEDKYLIRPKELGEDFASLLRKKIEISGAITAGGDEKVLRVVDHHLLPPLGFSDSDPVGNTQNSPSITGINEPAVPFTTGRVLSSGCIRSDTGGRGAECHRYRI